MNPYELEVVHSKLNTIAEIEEGSIANDLGLESGDQILSINGRKILDVIDYRYNVADPNILLLVQKRTGEVWEIEIEKDAGEDIGLSFASPLLDRQKQCSNHCVFCFIDQMPPGMRKSLYIKDDDSRLSFLQGNYITLTNVKKDDFDRIIEYKLSPINVSVHTTNPELRKKLLGNRLAGRVYQQLKELTQNGIQINAQIVAMPGINDGKELQRTLEDLAKLVPGLNSVAVVPIGLTKYREGLSRMETYKMETANRLIDLVEDYGRIMKNKIGHHWVYASDEFYLMAERAVPDEDYYDAYPQYENGVGLIRSFYEEASYAVGRIPGSKEEGRITLVTGEYAVPMLRSIGQKLGKKFPNLFLEIKSIKNNFFGDKVKVAGLLTARDLIDQLKGLKTNDIIVPRVMFRQDKFITLDDYKLEDLERKLNSRIIPCENDGEIFIEKILEVGLHG